MTGEGLSRRGFLKRAGAVVAGVAVPGAAVKLFEGSADAAGDVPPETGSNLPPDVQCAPPDTMPTVATTPEIPMSATVLSGAAEAPKLSFEAPLMAAEATYMQAVRQYYVDTSPLILERYGVVASITHGYTPEISDDGRTKTWQVGVEGKGTVMLSETLGEGDMLVQSLISFEDTTATIMWQRGEDGKVVCMPNVAFTPRVVRTAILENKSDRTEAYSSASAPTTTVPTQSGDPTGIDPSSMGPSMISSGSGLSAGQQAIANVQGTLGLLERIVA